MITNFCFEYLKQSTRKISNPFYMKPLLVMMLLINSFNIFCQDWTLFPYQTDMYYYLEGSTSLFSCKHDSISTDGVSTNYYFNTKAPEGISHECFDSVINFEDNLYYPDSTYQMQFTQNGDSLVNYNEHFGSMPAIFKPWAAVGTSWIVPNNSPASTFPEVEITCDSIVLGSFLGVTDSLKYFSVHTETPVTGWYTIDRANYVLSKHYGLIRFLPFYKLINPKSCLDCFKCYDLIGWNGIGSSAGYTGTKWDDWLELIPGDFLKYHYSYSTPLDTGFIVSSALILNVTRYADSVVIQYENHLGEIYEYAYYKKVVVNALTSTPWRPCYVPESPYQSELDEYVGIMSRSSYFLDTMILPGSTRFSQHFITTNQQNEINCTIDSLGELKHEISWDSYFGVTSEYKSDGESFSYYSLVGGIFNGIPFLDYLPVNIDEPIINKENAINIFPNPAYNLILFQIDANSYTQYFIYDITGKCHITSQTVSGKIDISVLPKGTYILNLISDSGSSIGKFVKL